MSKGVLIAIGISVALSLPFYGYRWNLLMHILGAILFMGNLLVSAVWFSMAKRSGSTEAVSFAARGVAATDVAFTTPGALLLFLNGGIIGTEMFKAGASWLILSTVIFVISGILWGAILVPIQRRMASAAAQSPPPESFQKDMSMWFRVGGVASLLPIVVLVLMVFKPTLW